MMRGDPRIDEKIGERAGYGVRNFVMNATIRRKQEPNGIHGCR